MPLDLPPNELLEWAVLLTGAALLIGAGLYLTLCRRWAELRLPPPPGGCTIEPFDALVGLCAYYFVVPMLIHYSLFLLWPDARPQSPEEPLGPAARTVTVLANLSIDCLILLLIGIIRFKRHPAAWGLGLRGLGRRILQAIAIYVALWPGCWGMLQVSTWLYERIVGTAPEQHESIQTLLDPAAPAWIVGGTIVGAVGLAPVVEELLFRGLLFLSIERSFRASRPAIVASGLIFGLIHLPLYAAVPALAAFGIVLAYVYARTRSLTLVILIHVAFNAKTVVGVLLSPATPAN